MSEGDIFSTLLADSVAQCQQSRPGFPVVSSRGPPLGMPHPARDRTVGSGPTRGPAWRQDDGPSPLSGARKGPRVDRSSAGPDLWYVEC